MRRYGLFAAIVAAALATPLGARDPQPRFSIGAIADCQYADEPDAPPRLYSTATAKLSAAIADFNRRPLAFVVHLGDFIDRDWRSYDIVLPIAATLHHPWRFVLGNHDFAVDDAHKPLVPARLGMPARYYRFVHDGWMFIVTDGNDLSSYAWPQGSPELAQSMAAHAVSYADKPLWDGGMGAVQLRWLDDRLGEADRRHLKVMIFSHFPVWPENPHNLWNAADVRSILERHPSMRIWLDGHNHDGNFGRKAGIAYVNLKGMLDTTETAYSILSFYDDRVVLHGIGRQNDLELPTRRTP